ncbi:MAG: HYR domain-containing protein [candidate division Zixibacteria bacterium]|nr:HYR domain-containing protein [candidate division Zixibacteria bacterium]
MIQRKQSTKRMILLLTISLAILSYACLANAQPQTDNTALGQMSSLFEDRLQAQRPQLYYDLLSSTDSPQLRLNRNSDIQLMFIGYNGKPFYYAIENINAASTISTDDVWPGGSGGFSLDGSDTDLGELCVWDAGAVLATHQEFAGRAIQMDSPGGTHYHSTHVAGTLISSGLIDSAKGMSYQGNLAAYDWNSDDSEMASAAASGMNVSSHSYGYITGWRWNGDWYWYGDIAISTTEDYGFGYYNYAAQAWDDIAANAPYYTICKSAGNDRNDYGPESGEGHYVYDSGWVWSYDERDPDGGLDGYDCVSWNGTAKNIITVGAVEDIPGGYTGPGDVVISSFSGWGPTDDGRIKPDLVANGIGLYSCMDDSNDAYQSLSGTSMSTPNLAGSLNLLVRHYEATHNNSTPLSSTMKGILIQTADEAGSATGPDYEFGWGLANTLKATQLIQDDSLRPGRIIEDSLVNGSNDDYYIFSDGTEPIILTLAWTDPPGIPPTPSLNPPDLMLVNDLDLRLEDLNDLIVHQPYILDPANPANPAATGDNFRDNAEQIYVDPASVGNYRIVVSHEGTLAETQYFSIICSHEMFDGPINGPPIALCQNITIYADYECQAFADIDNGSYDPDDDPITIEQEPDGPYPLGQTSVSLIVTDDGELADTCQAIVTVSDTTSPFVPCPNNIIVDNDPGECGAIVTYSYIGDDNCPDLIVTADPPPGSMFAIGITQVDIEAIDGSENTYSCHFDITVNDNENPDVICPDDTTLLSEPGQGGAICEFEASVSDNCPNSIVECDPPSGSFFPIGQTSVNCVGQDSSGNSDTCSFIVTVGSDALEYLPGDVNMYNGAWPPMVIGGDVTYLVSWFRGLSSSPVCPLDGFWCSADANGDCVVIGSDVTKLVTYFRGMTTLSHCADYLPAWLVPDDLPEEAPPGWPNCE